MLAKRSPDRPMIISALLASKYAHLAVSTKDDKVFWVDIEGKDFMFQSSLCDLLPDCTATEEDQEVGGKSGAGDGMLGAEWTNVQSIPI